MSPNKTDESSYQSYLSLFSADQTFSLIWKFKGPDKNTALFVYAR